MTLASLGIIAAICAGLTAVLAELRRAARERISDRKKTVVDAVDEMEKRKDEELAYMSKDLGDTQRDRDQWRDRYLNLLESRNK